MHGEWALRIFGSNILPLQLFLVCLYFPLFSQCKTNIVFLTDAPKPVLKITMRNLNRPLMCKPNSIYHLELRPISNTNVYSDEAFIEIWIFHFERAILKFVSKHNYIQESCLDFYIIIESNTATFRFKLFNIQYYTRGRKGRITSSRTTLFDSSKPNVTKLSQDLNKADNNWLILPMRFLFLYTTWRSWARRGFQKTKTLKHNKMILTNSPDARIEVQSIPTCTALATTMNTLYNLLLSKFLGHSANTSGGKIVIAWLYAPQAT